MPKLALVTGDSAVARPRPGTTSAYVVTIPYDVPPRRAVELVQAGGHFATAKGIVQIRTRYRHLRHESPEPNLTPPPRDTRPYTVEPVKLPSGVFASATEAARQKLQQFHRHDLDATASRRELRQLLLHIGTDAAEHLIAEMQAAIVDVHALAERLPLGDRQ